jgi:hypothetical protein
MEDRKDRPESQPEGQVRVLLGVPKSEASLVAFSCRTSGKRWFFRELLKKLSEELGNRYSEPAMLCFRA